MFNSMKLTILCLSVVLFSLWSFAEKYGFGDH